MAFKLEQTTVDRADEILTAQLHSTIQLRAHVRQMESKLGASDSRVAELLSRIARELRAIIELTNSRVTALGKEGTDLLQVDGDVSQTQLIDNEDSLEDLLTRFGRDERSTSERRA